jgi:23S rRNA (cytidine1920-2'-O)/16S rRNA (cytidine1409-2'-O)-methyltransferase
VTHAAGMEALGILAERLCDGLDHADAGFTSRWAPCSLERFTLVPGQHQDAAADGFTQALLDAGAARVYAVDAGAGQLRGWLRADPRVINLERTNLARLGPHLIGEPVDLITMDLSYLAIADAIGQVDRQMLAPAAQLITLVKPTFELHAAALADQPQQVAAAAEAATRALEEHRWRVLGQQPSPILGAKGAVEILLHAASGMQAQ